MLSPVRILAALCLIAGADIARADPFGDAELNAVSYAPLPSGMEVNIVVLDDSPENLRIKGELEAALSAHGVAVVADAPLRLTIDTSDSEGAWQSSSGYDQIPLRDDRGRLAPTDQLNVSRVGQYPLAGTTVVTPPRYRLGLLLDDRATGQRLWQGWSTAELSQGESEELAQAMVPKLVDSIGRTVRQERFPLQGSE